MWIFLKAQTIPNYKPHYESMTDSGQCNVSWFKKFLQGMPRIFFFRHDGGVISVPNHDLKNKENTMCSKKGYLSFVA